MAADNPLYYFSHTAHTNRPPLILIHGAGGNHLSWPPHLRRMADQTIYAPDLNGHGRSSTQIRTSIQEHAHDILSLLDSLNISQASLAGHSMGGAAALMLAHQHPERVHKLILAGTGATLRVAPALLEAASRPETFPNAVQMIVENSYHPRADARLKELTQRHMLSSSQATLHADLMACSVFNMLDALPSIPAPTLILCGADDKMTPPKLSHTLHELMPNSTLEIIPDTGHFLMQEREAEVMSSILKFLLM